MIHRPTIERNQRIERRIPEATRFIFTSPLNRVWKLSALGALYSIPAVLYPGLLDLSLPLEAVLTLAVGLMLSIRLRSSYDRWWEARTQWGALVNISRNLAVKLSVFAELGHEERVKIHAYIQAFARALKNHLRGTGSLNEIRAFNAATEKPAHVPAYLAKEIYHIIEGLRRDGRLSETQMLIIDAESRMLLVVCGACERIKNTLMAASFPAFIHFCLWTLILALPWDIAEKLGWFTVPVMALGTFMAIAGEVIAEANERPFGLGTDDLDLEGYCDSIDRTTAQILEVEDLV